MQTIDLPKLYKPFYTASDKKVAFIDTSTVTTISIDGVGSPDSEAFQNAVGALYTAAYTLKFEFKLRKQEPVDWKVMPLEGLWGTEGESLDMANREGWQWTVYIMMPEVVSHEDVAAAVEKGSKKRPNPALARVRLSVFEEGPCAQILHIGPYSEEPATIARLHSAIADAGGKASGRHHEIYLGDPRRTAPEKLKTILRQPYSKS